MDAIIYFIIICIFLLLKFFWRLKWPLFLEDGDLPLPPGTMGYPVLGESLRFLIRKGDFFKEKRDKYGEIYKTHLFGKPTIRISGQENLRKIILGENKIVRSCYPASVRKLLGADSLAMSSGQDHKIRKRQLMQYFCPTFLSQHSDLFSEHLADSMKSWCNSGPIDLYSKIHSCLIILAAKYLVSVEMSDAEGERLRKCYQDITENLFTLPINLPGCGFYKALKAKQDLKDMFRQKFKDSNNDRRGFPTVLEAYGALLEQGTEEDIFLNAIFELLFNAAETVSSTAFCLVYFLSSNPDVLVKLREELKSVDILSPPDDNNNETIKITSAVIEKLHYLDHVVKETMRLTPAVGGAYRTVLKTFDLDGFRIPEGWTIIFGIRETHQHDERVEHRETFDPDRWNSLESSDIGFFPFGGGARVCPGKNYARLVLKLFTIQLCRQCDWRLSENNPKLVFFPTPRPERTLYATFKERCL